MSRRHLGPDLEFGASSGQVMFVDGMRPGSAPSRKAASPAGGGAGQFIQGYACRFNKLHLDNQGRIEAFSRGCFSRTLSTRATVRMLINHVESKMVATTASGLELHADDEGLAFRCRLPDTPMGREVRLMAAGGQAQASVGFTPLQDEFKTIDGVRIRFIRQVDLVEFSITRPFAAAVKQTYVELTDDGITPLSQLCETKTLLADSHFAEIRRGMTKLLTAAGG